jgi:flavodoxin
MTAPRRALVIYATTSGSTAEVAKLIATELRHLNAALFDLRVLDDETSRVPEGAFDVVVAGTPTYGKGDWHPSWQRHCERVRPVLQSTSQLLLFALGDSRGHGATFAGGLGVLRDFVAAGRIAAADGCASRATPPVNTIRHVSRGADLAIEFRRDRRTAIRQVQDWLASSIKCRAEAD